VKPQSEYLFVEVAAQRCLQLMRGARPKVETSAHKYTTLAIAEVEAGTIPWKMREEGELELVATGLQEKAEAEAGDAA